MGKANRHPRTGSFGATHQKRTCIKGGERRERRKRKRKGEERNDDDDQRR